MRTTLLNKGNQGLNETKEGELYLAFAFQVQDECPFLPPKRHKRCMHFFISNAHPLPLLLVASSITITPTQQQPAPLTSGSNENQSPSSLNANAPTLRVKKSMLVETFKPSAGATAIALPQTMQQQQQQRSPVARPYSPEHYAPPPSSGVVANASQPAPGAQRYTYNEVSDEEDHDDSDDGIMPPPTADANGDDVGGVDGGKEDGSLVRSQSEVRDGRWWGTTQPGGLFYYARAKVSFTNTQLRSLSPAKPSCSQAPEAAPPLVPALVSPRP